MIPFMYPGQSHVRRHGPAGYADYKRYRPWLRDEFTFRCVYCLKRERWGLVLRLTTSTTFFLKRTIQKQLSTTTTFSTPTELATPRKAPEPSQILATVCSKATS